MTQHQPIQQIIAMGGGGFSMEPENPLLDRYVLAQTGKARPKVCFVPTASADAQGYIDNFYRFFEKEDCEPTHLPLWKNQPLDLRSFVLAQDVIYVGGGNTRNMIVLWREWGLDQILREAWEKGIILAGLSAGGICWFEEGLTDSNPGAYSNLPCLGFLSGSMSPHYDGEAERRPRYQQLIREGVMMDGLAADDGVGLHFIGTKLHKIISSRPHALAYSVKNVNGDAVEEALETTYLGN